MEEQEAVTQRYDAAIRKSWEALTEFLRPSVVAVIRAEIAAALPKPLPARQRLLMTVTGPVVAAWILADRGARREAKMSELRRTVRDWVKYAILGLAPSAADIVGAMESEIADMSRRVAGAWVSVIVTNEIRMNGVSVTAEDLLNGTFDADFLPAGGTGLREGLASSALDSWDVHPKLALATLRHARAMRGFEAFFPREGLPALRHEIAYRCKYLLAKSK
jgi:hypothetical protein